jgi:lipoprotein NlpI
MLKRRLFIKNAVLLLGLFFGTTVPACAEDRGGTLSGAALFDKAIAMFFSGQPIESARLFDSVAETRPELAPELWQRGIALYYAERFDDGRKQFELHRTVNGSDVENPAWHYLCVARASSPEEARRAMLPVGQDPRVPMREILALFKGDGSEEDVLATASRGEGKTLRNQLCYAHLYLGLYAEAQRDAVRAKKHILLAAGPFSMDHYMGRVAKVHAQLREWNEQK